MRSFIMVLATVLFVLLVALAGSSPAQPSKTVSQEVASYLVVMSAYGPELSKLLEEADVQGTYAINGGIYYFATLADNDVILVLSGIGLTNAAVTTQTALDHFDVSGIVFSGIAGGVNPNLNIGDVAIPAQWAHADGGLDPAEDDFWVPVDMTMLEVAREVCSSATLNDCTPDSVCLEHEPKIVTDGNGVSNSFFVDDSEYREWLWDTFQANAVDMETAAMARVAYDNDIPYIAFRSLSDLAGGGPGENEMGTFFQLAADNAAAVVLAFLETWAQSDIWAETVADGIPDGFSLDQNYPNPFNSSTMMSYSVPSAQREFRYF